MSREPNIIRAQKHWRAIEGLLLGLYGMVWLRYGLDSFPLNWLWSIVFWVASLVVLIPAILNIRANRMPAETDKTDSYRRLRVIVIAVNLLLIVLAVVVGQMFSNSPAQGRMISALAVLAGVYLLGLAAPLAYRLLFALGAIAVIWGLVGTHLFAPQNAAGYMAFGVGALLWAGSVASYDRPDPA